MAATKFTEAEREMLFAQLEAPFDPALIKWRVMRTFDDGRSGVILPFADPRAYTDRLNDLFTPSGWTREYTISTVPSLCRMERGKAIVTSKVLVATAVTIVRLGSHTGTGEEWADRENAVTAADAQAFKRACTCFGLGRYLYRFGETRVRLNSRGEPVAIPTLPEWALPPGMTVAQANGLAGDIRGPVDQRLTAEIEGFRGTLGEPIYAEILRRAGHSADARTIGAGVRPEIIAFLRFKPDLLHAADTTLDANAWPTPRSWEMASHVLSGVAHRQNTAILTGAGEFEAQLLDGTVGQAASAELLAFLRLFRQLPSIDEILLNPESAPLPTEPSAQIAISTALGRVMSDSSIGRGLKYLDRMPAEMRVMAMRDAAARDRAITHTPDFIRFGIEHQELCCF